MLKLCLNIQMYDLRDLYLSRMMKMMSMIIINSSNTHITATAITTTMIGNSLESVK